MRRLITIFTPTYNRGYILPELYHSLKVQTDRRFKWLVVDDGSTDDTRDLLENWKREGTVEINYIYQKNSGKSLAHNRAVALCDTELFACVDSDDQLSEDAVASILKSYENIGDAIGMVFMRKRKNGRLISVWSKKLIRARLSEAYRKYGASGDTLLVYITDIIKKAEFPVFRGEKFVPEAYLYDQLDEMGSLLFVHKAIYICEYLEDGYTLSMMKVIKNNPCGYLAYINQRLRKDRRLMWKAEDTVRYWAISISSGRREIIRKAVYPFLAVLTFPIGYILFVIKYKNV